MYGPLLTQIDMSTSVVFMLFLLSHAVGLLFYGFIVEYLSRSKDIDHNKELKLILLISVLLSFLTIIFPLLSQRFIIPVILLIGFFSGSLVVFYLYHISISIMDGRRGRILGFIFFLAGTILIPFLLIPYGSWMYVINGLLLMSPFLLLRDGLTRSKDMISNKNLSDVDTSYWLSLIFLVILFYIGGGLMYNLLYAELLTNKKVFFDIGFLFYPLIVLPVGIIADKKGRRLLINIGLFFSGLGFLLLLIFDYFNSLPMILLQSSFAVMDLFIFLVLMDWTDYFKSRLFIGTGLFLNVIIIFISGLPFLGGRISDIVPINLWPAVGLISILLIIPLLNFIKETYLIRQSKDILTKENDNLDSFCKQHSISPREKEVILFLLEGKDTGTITELMSISYNTLKTHLRNIYRKTDTGSQSELILSIWRNTRNIDIHNNN